MINRREALFLIGSVGCCAWAAENGRPAIDPSHERYDDRGYPQPESNAACANCHWWDELRGDFARSIGLSGNYRYGYCRFNAPTAQGFGRSKHLDRCGHFEDRDEK